MKGCILTGVWGAGKTSVFQHTLAQLVNAGRQHIIAMPQAATITTHTYTPGGPHEHASDVLSWLHRLAEFLEEAERRFHASTLPHHRFAAMWTPTCVLEGLGFDAVLYGLPINRDTLAAVEDRLAALGVHLVLLRVPDDCIRFQCVESTRRHRGEKWRHYLEGFGATDGARADYVSDAQSDLMQWVRTSPLPLHVLDTATQDWASYASQVAALLTT